MLRKRGAIELQQRITALYLFFGLAAVVWLVFGVGFACVRILNSRTESACLTQLGRISSAISIDYLRNGEQNVQSLVESLKSKGSFSYCAVSTLDGLFLAHSTRESVGRAVPDAASSDMRWGESQRVKCSTPRGTILEYRAPLKKGSQTLGTIHVGLFEPSAASLIAASAPYAPVAIGGPLVVIAIGLIVIRRMIRPVASLEGELRKAATARAVDDVQLAPVEATGLASLGWNRLVAEWNRVRESRDEPVCEQSLGQRLQQRKLDEILNGLADGVAVTDAESRLTFANNALLAILNEADTSALQQDALEDRIAQQWPMPADCALLAGDAQQRKVSVEIEDPEQTPTGYYRIVRSPLNDSRNGHVWSVRDITQQKQVEKMRAQFVDTATHELRTPLSNIKAYAETLALTDMVDVEKQKDFLNTINIEATRLARFVDDLLCISSMEVGSLTVNRLETDLLRMFDEVVAKIKPQLDVKQITFEKSVPAKLPKLHVDKDKLAASLVNLLGNAAKYTPPEGHVAFRVRATQQELTIDVVDTGVGISPEELPRVFEKFFRSKDPRVQDEAGTGLGLSLAREVVRLHGGQLTAQSELNKGTTFTITLPLT